jgi:glycosyltransferase involved in cell wall biosynthesis
MKIGFYYGDKQNSGEYDNGIWMDILKVPFLQKIEEAENFDVIIRTLWMDATISGWSRQIRNRYPHIIQIGLSDHPLSTHISKLSPDKQMAYIADLQYLDGLMALTEEEREWYQTVLPAKPVIKAGLPFPFDSYTKKYSKFVDSEKKYIGLGVGASDNDRNFISSALVFAKLKMFDPTLEGVFLSLPSYLIAPTSVYADAIPGIKLHERVGMEAFYDLLSQCKFVINLADRNTPGRIQGEAAFFGVPVIGSDRLELQTELFPELAISPYSLEKAEQLGKALLNNPQIGDRMVQSARKKLEVYNYRKSKGRFNKLLKEILSKREI